MHTFSANIDSYRTSQRHVKNEVIVTMLCLSTEYLTVAEVCESGDRAFMRQGTHPLVHRHHFFGAFVQVVDLSLPQQEGVRYFLKMQWTVKWSSLSSYMLELNVCTVFIGYLLLKPRKN